MNEILLLRSDAPELDALEGSLAGDVATIALADVAGCGWDDAIATLDASLAAVDGMARYRGVVAAMWTPATRPRAALLDCTESIWYDSEVALAAWFGCVQAAARAVRDSGSVVALVERPGPIDAGGRSVETMICDAVEALVRCVARAEGPRGVRVNCVQTVGRLVPPDLIAPTPPLLTYPGRMADEIAGAIRMLMNDDAIGCTGQVVHADCGRVM